MLFLTNDASVKGRNLQRDPRVTLVVQDETPPYAFVMIEGAAESSTNDSEARRAATTAIGLRYAGPEGVQEFEEFAREALTLFVRVRPAHILALNRVAEK